MNADAPVFVPLRDEKAAQGAGEGGAGDGTLLAVARSEKSGVSPVPRRVSGGRAKAAQRWADVEDGGNEENAEDTAALYDSFTNGEETESNPLNVDAPVFVPVRQKGADVTQVAEAPCKPPLVPTRERKKSKTQTQFPAKSKKTFSAKWRTTLCKY